jgi:dihydrofolate reductase
MQISLIVAMAKNRVIGCNNQLPWHLPADLKHFKERTLGKPIIMGRRTFESIGKPLPGRHNIVVTHDPLYQISGCSVVHSLDEAFSVAGEVDEIIIIGGATLYQEAIPFVQRMYITVIDCEIDGDVYFPDWDPVMWEEVQRKDYPADETNAYAFSVRILDRVNAFSPFCRVDKAKHVHLDS